MGSRVVIVSWLILAACGRLGFEQAEHGSTVDAHGDGGSVSIDGPNTTIDAPNGPPADAFLCAYMMCSPGKVTCCETSGSPMCIDAGAPCMSNFRFECDQPTNTGCAGGEMCCITQSSQGTECIDPLLDPCFG